MIEALQARLTGQSAGHRPAPDRQRAPIKALPNRADRSQSARDCRHGRLERMRRMGIVFDFWIAPRAYRFDDGSVRHRTPVLPPRIAITPASSRHVPRSTVKGSRAPPASMRPPVVFFLLWFDTRPVAGTPGLPLDDGRVLLLRAFKRARTVALPWKAWGRGRDAVQRCARGVRLDVDLGSPTSALVTSPGLPLARGPVRAVRREQRCSAADRARRGRRAGGAAPAARAVPMIAGMERRPNRRRRHATSRSCAPSPTSRASSSIGPFRATASTSTRS